MTLARDPQKGIFDRSKFKVARDISLMKCVKRTVVSSPGHVGPQGGIDLRFIALSQHQLMLRDHGYGASASRGGVPVYAPAFAKFTAW